MIACVNINICVPCIVVSFGLSAAPAMLDEDDGVDAVVTVAPIFPSGGSAVSFSLTIETEDDTATSKLYRCCLNLGQID